MKTKESITMLASLIALLFSLGSLGYHFAVVKKDIEHISSQHAKTEKQTNKIESKLNSLELQITALLNQQAKPEEITKKDSRQESNNDIQNYTIIGYIKDKETKKGIDDIIVSALNYNEKSSPTADNGLFVIGLNNVVDDSLTLLFHRNNKEVHRKEILIDKMNETIKLKEIFLVMSEPESSFPIEDVFIDNFNMDERAISGKVTLSSDSSYKILIFAGKNGGPYWLQGSKGNLFSETRRRAQYDKWQAEWIVPEVFIGTNVVDVRAIAIIPKDTDRFVNAGIPDPYAGNAIKIESLSVLPDPKKISQIFKPVTNYPSDSTNQIKMKLKFKNK